MFSIHNVTCNLCCIHDSGRSHCDISLSFEARMETKHNDLVDEVRSDFGLLHVSQVLICWILLGTYVCSNL